MPHQTLPLDLVILGYKAGRLADEFEAMKRMKDFSGGYRRLALNSALFFDSRISFMTMINLVRQKATGKDSDLNIADLPNPAVFSLASYVNKKGFRSEIVNFFNHEKERLIRLLQRKPHAVAVTTTFYTEASPIIDIVEFIRMHDRDTKIIIGGPFIYNFATNYNRKALEFWLKKIDADIYVTDPQGNDTLCKILNALANEACTDLENIPNLIYPDKKGEFTHTANRAENISLDESSVGWSDFDASLYSPTVQLCTTRGCVFNCNFCSYPLLAGDFSLQSVDSLERELCALKKGGVKYILFVDDTFNIPQKRFKDICRMMIRHNFGFKWFSFFRCSDVDDETFDLMQKSGCMGVHIGIESGSQKILENMNKHIPIDQYKDGISQLRKRGIFSVASIVVGFPGETQQSILKTIDFLQETKPDWWQPELFHYFKNAPIHKYADQYRLKGQGYNWEHATMSWMEACDYMDEMARQVTHSTILPDYGCNIWGIPYLLGQGLTFVQIKKCTEIFSRLIIESIGNDFLDTSKYEKDLMQIFTEAQT